MSSLSNFIFLGCLITTLLISDTPNVTAKTQSSIRHVITGYSALKLLLEDEQYLTTIRRTKMVITFSSISEQSIKLIDNIADHSEQNLEQLEQLSQESPSFSFKELAEDSIAITTLDSLRLATAKEFLFNNDHFEKDLLISQLKVLRVISHLAMQIGEKEISTKRKKWLTKLAKQYERYYQQVHARILISGTTQGLKLE